MVRQAGFSIIELMMVVVILGVIVGYGVPSFKDFYTKKRVIAATEAVYGHFQQARTESIARSLNMFVEVDASGNFGSRTTTGCDPAQADPTDASACFIEISGENVLNRVVASEFSNVVITGNDLQFDPRRGMAVTSGSTTITHSDDANVQLRVTVGPIGRIKICIPAGSTHIPGYPDCT